MKGVAVPAFSVVVCTLDRERSLRRALRGLARLRGASFEVIVVNGPSRDGSAQVARRAGARLVEIAQRNLSAARNAGARTAAGRIVAFLDDDAVPARDWLAEIAPAFDGEGVVAVGGPVLDRDGGGFPGPLGVSPLGFPRPWSGNGADSPYVTGGNMAFARRALFEAGGFDENLPFHLEDADLCLRLRKRGGRIEFRERAIVYHDPKGATPHRRPEVVIRSASYFAFRHARGWASAALLIAPLLHALARVRRAPADSELLLYALRCLQGAFLGYGAVFRRAPRLPLAP